MDQYPAYWMWARRKLSGRSHVQSLSDDSWEEQAFAVDSSSSVEGSIWPPRSYTCSFCRREFRSAQALGGHMNVHRRDRARLKQSNSHVEDQSHYHHQNPCGTSLGVEFPSRICNLISNNELSLKSIARVTAPFIPDNCRSDQKILVSSACSLTIGQETDQSSLFSFTPTLSDHNFTVSDSKHDIEVLVPKPGPESPDGCLVDSIRERRQQVYMDGDEEGFIMSKRRRVDLSSTPVFRNPNPSENMAENASLICFLKPNTGARHHLRSEAVRVRPSSSEPLDLELRLGGCPKVK